LHYPKEYVVALQMTRKITDYNKTQESIIAFYDDDRLGYKGILNDENSIDSVASSMKLLKRNKNGIAAVTHGDNATRSIKMQKITIDSIESEEIYHYKAKHGSHKYRERKTGLNDTWNYSDEDDETL
jgi:hypothetical protein